MLACGEVMRQTRPISVEGYKPLAGQGACTQGEAEYAQGIEQELRGLDSRLFIFRGTSTSSLGTVCAPHEAFYWFRLRTSLKL